MGFGDMVTLGEDVEVVICDRLAVDSCIGWQNDIFVFAVWRDMDMWGRRRLKIVSYLSDFHAALGWCSHGSCILQHALLLL